MEGKKFTVEFSVDQFWIEDGFTMDDERALDVLANLLPWASDYELAAKVIKTEDIK